MANPILKTMLRNREFVAVPDVFDLMSAKIAGQSKAKALYMTGYGAVASYLGYPDAGIRLGDRAAEALVGVPLGLVLALAAPHTPWLLRSAGVGGLLMLIVFRLHPVGFGAQCALIAMAVSVTAQLSGAVGRVENVLIGGAIGLAFVVAAHETARLVARHLADVRPISH
jgi:uncharacterized membrane protein YccC